MSHPLRKEKHELQQQLSFLPLPPLHLPMRGMMMRYPSMSVLLYPNLSISQPEMKMPIMTPQLTDWPGPACHAALTWYDWDFSSH